MSSPVISLPGRGVVKVRLHEASPYASLNNISVTVSLPRPQPFPSLSGGVDRAGSAIPSYDFSFERSILTQIERISGEADAEQRHREERRGKLQELSQPQFRSTGWNAPSTSVSNSSHGLASNGNTSHAEEDDDLRQLREVMGADSPPTWNSQLASNYPQAPAPTAHLSGGVRFVDVVQKAQALMAGMSLNQSNALPLSSSTSSTPPPMPPKPMNTSSTSVGDRDMNAQDPRTLRYTQMGFPLPAVSYIVGALAQKPSANADKDILDFLLIYTSLPASYDAADVHFAMSFLGNDTDEVRRFCDDVIALCELGFDKGNVRRALKEGGSREAGLEMLVR
ncbi:hypothetical protein BC832DRAFT_549313 [Gaertneriomyces semiglobifer]|nr:hypothetical protein BC832DRAFT_549313 [Gaertneriomyces semiglobifer]